MSKLTIFVTLFYGALMLTQIAFMLPMHWFQWAILIALLSNCFREWHAGQRRAEQRDATWGKYDRPGDSKAPTYHDL